MRRLSFGRLAVVLVVLFVTAVYAGVAHADNVVVVDDNAPAASDTGTTTDPVTEPAPTDPSTDPSGSQTDPTGTPTEPPADPTPTEPPADNTGTDPTPAPGDTTPPPNPVDPGDTTGTGASDGGTPVATEPPPPVEPPPVVDPVTPIVDEPSSSPPTDANGKQHPVPPPFASAGTADVDVPLAAPVAAPLSLDLLKIAGTASTKGRDPRLSDDGTRSTKEQSARRSLPSEGSPASSPSSAASGAAGSSGGGTGVALAVEFLLAALVVLRYTRKAAFILPDSLAFALREARPG